MVELLRRLSGFGKIPNFRHKVLFLVMNGFGYGRSGIFEKYDAL